jgi:hypothetical protein
MNEPTFHTNRFGIPNRVWPDRGDPVVLVAQDRLDIHGRTPGWGAARAVDPEDMP